MTSRSSPASLRGAPREAQEGPKRRQGLPKTTPRAGQRATRAAHMRSQSGLGGHLGHTWRPKAPGGLPDAILVPSGFDFVPFGNRFSRPPKTRPGGSRELHHFGTMLNLFGTLPEPIAASLGPAALPNFGRTWQRRRRNIKRLRVAQGPPRGLQGAFGGFLLGQC